MSIENFLGQFKFKPKLRWHIGIERERFTATPDGVIIPAAREFLEKIRDPLWTYELSACQVEDRTRPRKRAALVMYELLRNDVRARRVAKKLGLKILAQPVGPPDMPLDVHPDPRYQEIAKRISKAQLQAACRVAGIHIHIGMPDMETAIKSHNRLVKHLDELCELGDCSQGERLRLYKTMAVNWKPPEIENPAHFFEIAQSQNFHNSPRSCYWLIRISVHGTIELRMFDTPPERPTIIRYAAAVMDTLRRNE